MVDMICRVCPTAKLYLFKLETHLSQGPLADGQTHNQIVARSATQSIDAAVARRDLGDAIERALDIGIFVFCAAGGAGNFSHEEYPYEFDRNRIIRIGAATGDGRPWERSGDSHRLNFIFPGYSVVSRHSPVHIGNTIPTEPLPRKHRVRNSSGSQGVVVNGLGTATPVVSTPVEAARLNSLKDYRNMKSVFQKIGVDREIGKFIEVWEYLEGPTAALGSGGAATCKAWEIVTNLAVRVSTFWVCWAIAIAQGATTGTLKSHKSIKAPVVDLDYAVYQGSYDSKFHTNIFRGIRFAAPPKRWQLPEAPKANRTSIIQATDNPPRCPQSGAAPGPAVVNFTEAVLGNEDCLFLNVFAPANAKKLPVLVWIHGGGYGLGSAAGFDFSHIAQTVNNGFVTVTIQYRLGAFGFLSSADLVNNGGVTNAGLHDQRFALQWVKNNFDDPLPTSYYHDLARRANCLNTTFPSIFSCLQQADTLVLQNASSLTSYSARFNQWAFIPVTDNKLILSPPTKQLVSGKVNGEAVLAGSNSNEGHYFTPQNITTPSSFTSFLSLNYPFLSPAQITSILSHYSPSSNLSLDTPVYESNGLTPPSQQPSQAQPKAGSKQPTTSTQKQHLFFSPPGVGFHGSDMAPLLNDALVGREGTVMDEEFRRGFQGVWGRFITTGDPTLKGRGEGVAAAVEKGVWRAAGEGGRWDLLNLNVTVAADGKRENTWAVVDADGWEGGRGRGVGFGQRLGFVERAQKQRRDGLDGIACLGGKC
ncbi:Alpha/Beta hydrolase protein [Apiosordaria backusii]|uniref:Alpha/Beta hydrolase protein n=1 Tax=Apiosordaria backusii TaxID=314023 RepID=A0AA40K3L3_9PEZI|nr:Alpha/Beta hydrolase protein [Apiosordaria backusii]